MYSHPESCPGFSRDLFVREVREDSLMTKTSRFSPEVREGALQLVFNQEPDYDSQWACIEAIAPRIGFKS